jgi:uncharacterized DUF497 family protein
MRIGEIVWLDVIVDKIAIKHQVGTDEVEAVFDSQPRFRFVERGKRLGEDLYLALGRTEAGRYLTVLFIHKANKDALILSARSMERWEKRLYERK